MKKLQDITFVCLDCEMTGLDPEHDRVIEVAVVKFNFTEILSSFESLVYTDRLISPEALAVHHISSEMLINAPPIKAILPQLFSVIGDGAMIVGHSIGCDVSILSKEAERAEIPFPKNYLLIDTLRLARDYGDSPNNALDTLAGHFNIPRGGAHRAMNDVKTNIEVFKKLTKRYKSLEILLSVLSKPVKMKYMPLGKYKGRLFADIPLQYLQWALSMDFDLDLLHSIRSEIRHRQQGQRFSQITNPFSEM
ncbi:Uncharacterized protein CLAVI_000362 [Candidatus Clavichlamydia salmonicola]|uniref:putative quorum-sensing-regulated virulence factor n=1 Tax=Candidatus Clavichlamydia salmonicola TaxID=469812 RepID=UPI001891B872|nr:DUF3820 family protein [Candidatus Clavichlamydia salmonicola]MBF5050744.1 Uncharacterized protein [Candidatus Clavichlamydia salmonicola]